MALRSALPIWPGTFAVIWLVYRLVKASGLYMRKGIGQAPKLLEIILHRCRGPIQMLIALALIRTLLPALSEMPYFFSVITNILSLLFIGGAGWLATRIVYVASDYFVGIYRVQGRDPYYIRKLQTQVQFLRRLVIMLIMLVAIATGLMVFDKVRQLGASILASAGIAGVIIGVAAQRTLANLLVGLQIAITQPIRLGDIVTVEKETGTIEQIYSTFAIIQTWDQRRLIVPLTYFTEKQFQNLTLSSSELLGAVVVYVDYSVPVDAIRSELQRILRNSDYWDGRKWSLSVSHLSERSVELTAVVSATDSPSLGNLRGEVREKLLAYLQNNFPDGLPKFRAELEVGKSRGGDLKEDVLHGVGLSNQRAVGRGTGRGHDA